MIISRTPLRITLAGGGTDLPSYYSLSGGLVLSMAINKHIYISYKPDFFQNKVTLRYSEIEVVNDSKELKNHRARQCLLKHNIHSSCEINSCADLPSNTGMGSSGTFVVGLLNAIREYKKLNREAYTLANEACFIEIDQLKEPVGKQDQFIAAFGGIKLLKVDRDGTVEVENFNINCNTLSKLLSNFCVYYLNVKRNASDVLEEQSKSKNSIPLLDKIKEQCYKSLDLLLSNKLDEYGLLMDEYWNLKKQLSSKVSFSLADEIYEETKRNYCVLGGKLIGAGGGGFILLYCTNKHENLTNFMKEKGYSKLDFQVDDSGSVILGNFL